MAPAVRSFSGELWHPAVQGAVGAGPDQSLGTLSFRCGSIRLRLVPERVDGYNMGVGVASPLRPVAARRSTPPPAHGRMEDSALHVLPCAKRGRGGREADGGGKPQGHSTVPPQPAPCSTQATSPAPHTWRHPPPVHKPARSSASCRFDWKESVTSSPFATASDYDRNRTHLRQSTPCPLASYSRPENPEAGHRDVLGWRLDH